MKRHFRVWAMVIGLSMSVACAMQNRPATEDGGDLVFYPVPPQSPRLQYLYSINSDEDLGKTQSALSRFIRGNLAPHGTVGFAYDLGSAPGRLYYIDRSDKKLMGVDLLNKKIYRVRDKGQGLLVDPSGLFVDRDGNKYVADMARKQVVVFGKDDAFTGTYGSGDILEKPVDVAVYASLVYICDLNRNQVFAFDKISGDLVRTMGEVGSENGNFYKPTHLTIDPDGNLYVNDSFNFRIQKFDTDGKFVQSFGHIGEVPGTFARPKGIDVSREGHLYALDAAFENAQIFDANNGKLLLSFGGSGNEPGNMFLPTGICVDYENVEYFRKFFDKDFSVAYLVWVSNRFGDRKLSVYGFGKWRNSTGSTPLTTEN